MPGNPYKYTPEYRVECADYVIGNELTITEGAKALGVNAKTLGAWVSKRRKELRAKAEGTDVAPTTTNAELRRAQKRIRELEMENAFLKKPQPSSPKTKREKKIRAHARGEGKLSRQDDGKSAWCVQIRLL